MYANHFGYSDVTPYEVIKENTPMKLTIREMKCELKKDWVCDFIPGGFFGHTSNNGGEWDITSNEEGYVTEIRMNKKGSWHDKHGRRFKLADKPVKYYDYNF